MGRHLLRSSLHALLLTAGAAALLCLPPWTARANFLEDIGSGIESLGDAVGQAVTDGVKGGKAMTSGEAEIIGTYRQPGSGKTVTCFKGIKSGYVLPPGAGTPGAYGTELTALDCDKLTKQRGFVWAQKPGVPGTATGGKPGTAPAIVQTDACDHNSTRGFAGRGSATRTAVCDTKRDIAEYGLLDDFDRKKAAYEKREQASAKQQAAGYKDIQKKADSSFADIQAQVARDAAAARAQAKAAQSQ